MTLTFHLEQEPDGRWIARVVDLPGVQVHGETAAEATSKVKSLALRVLADRLEQGETDAELGDVAFVVASTGGGQRIIGVFKGGGAKGALYSGALEAVRDRGLWFSQVAGSSAGAITAAFVAAGAGPEELRSDEAHGRALLAMPTATSGALNLRNRGGILSFDVLRSWLAERLTSLYVGRLGGTEATDEDEGPTFRQLEAAAGIPLHIVCADLKWRVPAVFNARLSPDLPVAVAAAASSAIPLVFDPPTLLSSYDLANTTTTKVPVSDGGVMANLPVFIFSDEGFRSMVYDVDERVDPNERPDPVVAFTFVEGDSPRHSRETELGNEYRMRLKPLKIGLTTARLKGDAPSAKRDDDKPPPKWHVAAVRRRVADIVRAALAAVLVGVLRVIEVVVLPLFTLLFRLTEHNTPLGVKLSDRTKAVNDRSTGRRARRWLRFADVVFDQSPLVLVAAVGLLVPVLLVGMPNAAASIWPDWSSILEDRRWPAVAGGVGTSLLAVSALTLVFVLQVLGVGALLAGWVIKPVAAATGPDLLATFLQNPQEPAWAYAGKETVVQIIVPKGWTALKSPNDSNIDDALSDVRESVREQLERHKLGTAPA
jgi:NTE family protein